MAKTYTGSYELTGGNFGVRLTYAAAKESGTWYAWITRVEVKMAQRTGTYSVNTFGDVCIDGTASASVSVTGTSVAGQAYATAWEGTGAKVPVSKSGTALSFALSFRKNSSYGSAYQMYFYGSASGTVKKGSASEPMSILSSRSVAAPSAAIFRAYASSRSVQRTSVSPAANSAAIVHLP